MEQLKLRAAARIWIDIEVDLIFFSALKSNFCLPSSEAQRYSCSEVFIILRGEGEVKHHAVKY